MKTGKTAVAVLAAAGVWAQPSSALAAFCESICNTTSTLADTVCERELVDCVRESYEYDCGYTDYYGNHTPQTCTAENEVCHTTGFEPLTCGQFGVFHVPPRPNALHPVCAQLCNDFSTIAATPCDTPVDECQQNEYYYDCSYQDCYTDYYGNSSGCSDVSQVCVGYQTSCRAIGYYDNTCGNFGVYFTPPPPVALAAGCVSAPTAGGTQQAQQNGQQSSGDKKFFGIEHDIKFTNDAKNIKKGELKFGADFILKGRAGSFQNELAKLSVTNAISSGQPDQLDAKFYVLKFQVWGDQESKSTERPADAGPLAGFFPPDPHGPKKKDRWERTFVDVQQTFFLGPVPVTTRLRVNGKASIETKFDAIKEAGSQLPVGLYAAVGPQATLSGMAEAYINLLIAHAGARANVNVITAGFYPGAKLYINHPTKLVHAKLLLSSSARALDGSLTLFARVWLPFRWREYGTSWNWGPAWKWDWSSDDKPPTCTFVTCGNGACDGGESFTVCPADCPPPPPPPPPVCGDGACDPTEYGWCGDCGSTGYCGDGACDQSELDWCNDCGSYNDYFGVAL
jgi:hypothetical protein